MLKLKDWPAFLLGGAIAAFAYSLLAFAVDLAVRRGAQAEPPEPVLAPPCDTSANASDAAAQLRARIASGAELGECDLQQLDHVAGFIDDWDEEWLARARCESDLRECEWGWWDAAECRRYQEASRIEDAIDAIYSCAEAGR